MCVCVREVKLVDGLVCFDADMVGPSFGLAAFKMCTVFMIELDGLMWRVRVGQQNNQLA